MLHNYLCAILLVWCCLILAPAVGYLTTCLWNKTRFFRMRMVARARYRRSIRRYKAAMKVFNKSVRWCEDAENRRSAQRLRQR